jgi:pimeloyl-ACP methyl ester carboxylesterase
MKSIYFVDGALSAARTRRIPALLDIPGTDKPLFEKGDACTMDETSERGEESIDYIKIEGKRLEIARHGPPPEAAPTLVFLHEGLGCVALWRDFPFELAEATGCGALVYSRLGYGRSDPSSLPLSLRYMHREGLRVLPELIKAAGIRQCILIGHSDGGSIALIYAGGTPAEPLCGLVTEAAHVFCEEINVRSIQQAKTSYLQSDLRERLRKYHGANVDCAFWGWNGAWLHPEFIHWNIEAYLPGIKVPVLAIQGENDEYGTPLQVEAIVNKAGSDTEMRMLPDCGHAPHVDQRTETFNAMKRFILRIFNGPDGL